MTYTRLSAGQLIRLHDTLDDIYESLSQKGEPADEIKHQLDAVRATFPNTYPFSVFRQLKLDDCEAIAAGLQAVHAGPLSRSHVMVGLFQTGETGSEATCFSGESALKAQEETKAQVSPHTAAQEKA